MENRTNHKSRIVAASLLQVRTNIRAGKDCGCRKQKDGSYLCSKDWNAYSREIVSITHDGFDEWQGTCTADDPYGQHGVKGWG